jgi:hypothetical protein
MAEEYQSAGNREQGSGNTNRYQRPGHLRLRVARKEILGRGNGEFVGVAEGATAIGTRHRDEHKKRRGAGNL